MPLNDGMPDVMPDAMPGQGGSLFAPAAGAATVALEMVLGPPLVNISQGLSVMEAGARQWVAVKVDLADMAKGYAVDPAQYAVAMAITQGDPSPSDYLPAEWLGRTAEPDPGVYAMILAGAGAVPDPGVGHWRVYVQVPPGGEELEERAPGYLTVE